VTRRSLTTFPDDYPCPETITIANSDGNSVENSVALMDGRNGGKLRRGNPGNSGRPPAAFSEHLRDIMEQPEVQAAFMAIITDPSHGQFTSLWKAAAAYAYGRPPQTIKLGKDSAGPDMIVIRRVIVDPQDGTEMRSQVGLPI
jgi:hypothetical protein